MLLSGTAAVTTAQVTGHGITVVQVHQAASAEAAVAAAPLAAVVVSKGDSAQVQLLLGMLMILAGLFFHGLYVTRVQRLGGAMGKKQRGRRKSVARFARRLA